MERCKRSTHDYFSHDIVLDSVLIFSFGYPHYLHTKIFPRVKCVWADVICQYWPWALSKVNGYAELKSAMSAHPCLSVMHAKAHSWHCQVIKVATIIPHDHCSTTEIRFCGEADGKLVQQMELEKKWNSYLATSAASI